MNRRSGLQKTVSMLIALSLVGGLLIGLALPPESGLIQAAAQQGIQPAGIVYLPVVIKNAGARHAYLPLLMVNYEISSVFGVQMDAVTDPQGLQQALDARMVWARSAPFAWDKIEPVRQNPPAYDWSVVDETSLLNAARNGLTYIGLVHYTPTWAQAVPGHSCGPIRQDELDAFGQFLQALVSRYGQAPYYVHFWELWNEPDVDPSLVAPDSIFGCWGDQNDAYYGGGYYAEMLKVAYPAIKAADPQAQVLLGGLLLDSPSKPSIKFLEGVLRNGGGPYFDVLAIHAYSYGTDQLGVMRNPNWPGSVTAIPEKVAFVRGVLGQYGFGQKPVMSTESALLCFKAWEACLETQAMYVPRAYADALALGLTAQIYFSMVEHNVWYQVGLLLPDLTPRPAYNAYKAATSFLTAVQYLGSAVGYPVGIEGYAFAQKASLRSVDVIWSADGSVIDVPLPEGAQAYDRYGVLITPPGTIQVDYSPVYVVKP